MPEHEWPDSSEHLWGPWLSQKYDPPKSTQYRVCVHPRCNEVDERVVPRA